VVKNRRIVAAAVRLNGQVYSGLRHGVIMQEIWAKEGDNPSKITQEQIGFLTNTGEFLSRFDAGLVAYCAEQTTDRKSHLFSEDLW
jgi:hypothetical protein